MLGRLKIARRHGSEAIARTLLFQGQEHGSAEWTARYAVDHEFVHCDSRTPAEASFANRSSKAGQPPSTPLRIFSPAAAPMRSKFRCSSSTRSEEHTSELQSR